MGTKRAVSEVRTRRHLQARPIVQELGLLVVVWLAYEAGRWLVQPDPGQATQNADWILQLQQALGLWIEPAIQQAAMASQPLVRSLNWYYAVMHLAPTVFFLGWLYVKRPDRYPIVRTILLVATGVGFLIHWLYPVAPPRLFDPSGMVDTLALYEHPMAYSSEGMEALTNPFAAMPSFHFGWALFIAVGAVLHADGRARWAALFHPALMLFAIVATGNHFLLDAVAAGVLEIVVAALIVTGCHCLTGWPRGWRCPRQLGPAVRWWLGLTDEPATQDD